jgi:hypothetical protein
VGLERGPLRLVSIIEELLGRNNSGSGLENREYGCGDPLHWPRDTLYPQKLTLTSPTDCGRSVGIVRLRTKTTEFSLVSGSGSRKPRLTAVGIRCAGHAALTSPTSGGRLVCGLKPRSLVLIYSVLLKVYETEPILVSLFLWWIIPDITDSY